GWATPEERLSDNQIRSDLEAQKKRGTLLPENESLLKALNAKEEKLSHAWETYLAEGKAPTASLRGLFARFRRWMGEVYGGLGGIAEQYKKTYGEDLRLSDEVRGVFSRLLAVDNEVERLRGDDGSDWAGVLRLTPEEAAREGQLREQKYQEAR